MNELKWIIIRGFEGGTFTIHDPRTNAVYEAEDHFRMHDLVSALNRCSPLSDEVKPVEKTDA